MKINTFVVDDSIEFTKDVEKYFRISNQINLVKICHDGEEACNYLDKHFHELDCVVLDLILPRKDGIDILKLLNSVN